jgi:adenosylcobinamide-GDP ribazoletransferase
MKRTLFLPLIGIIVGGVGGVAFLAAEALFASKALAVVISLTASMLVTGAFLETGSIALVMGVLLRYQSLLLIPSRSIPFVLIAAHAFSRFAAGSLVISNDSEKRSALSTRDLILMVTIGMLPLLLVGNLLFLLLVPLLWVVRTLFGVWLCRSDGDYTSARHLTTQHAVEICFYLLVVLAFTYAFDKPAIG